MRLNPKATNTRSTGTERTQPELLDVRTVAALLNCSTRHVYRLSDAGRMPPPLKLGQLVRWRRTELADWISDGCPAVRRAKGGRAAQKGGDDAE